MAGTDSRADGSEQRGQPHNAILRGKEIPEMEQRGYSKFIGNC